MDAENSFHQQLGRTIQSWLWVESELYILYAILMQGANSHLVSVTFNNILSVDSKISLLNSCLTLILPKGGEEKLHWRKLHNKAESLNKKRNKIVHEPMVISFEKGRKSIAISPSHFNALALVKGQTTNKRTVVSADYKPSQAKVLIDHTIDFHGLCALENTFKEFSHELRDYRIRIEPLIRSALLAAKKKGEASGTA